MQTHFPTAMQTGAQHSIGKEYTLRARHMLSCIGGLMVLHICHKTYVASLSAPLRLSTRPTHMPQLSRANVILAVCPYNCTYIIRGRVMPNTCIQKPHISESAQQTALYTQTHDQYMLLCTLFFFCRENFDIL